MHSTLVQIGRPPLVLISLVTVRCGRILLYLLTGDVLETVGCSKAVVTSTIPVRFDSHSTAIRLQFDVERQSNHSRNTVERPSNKSRIVVVFNQAEKRVIVKLRLKFIIIIIIIIGSCRQRRSVASTWNAHDGRPWTIQRGC